MKGSVIDVTFDNDFVAGVVFMGIGDASVKVEIDTILNGVSVNVCGIFHRGFFIINVYKKSKEI